MRLYESTIDQLGEFQVRNAERSRRENVGGEMRALQSGGEDDGIFVAWGSEALDDIGLHDDFLERRVVGILTGVELERRVIVAPDPVRVAVAEVGDNVVRDDGATVGVVSLGLAIHGWVRGGAGHQADGPEIVFS